MKLGPDKARQAIRCARVELGVAILCLVVSACTTQPGAMTDLVHFSTRPNEEKFELHETRPQQGNRGSPEVTDESFREITVAQGSGMDGFETIRIFSDGTGYAVAPLDNSRAARVPLYLSHQQLTLLVRAIQQDRLRHIKGMYSSGADDGTQGFVELVTSRGRVYSWLDNYFEPASHVFEFCNQHIWPEVSRRAPAYRLQRNFNFQEEYYRVFHNKA